MMSYSHVGGVYFPNHLESQYSCLYTASPYEYQVRSEDSRSESNLADFHAVLA
jgi:hypothetical protein